MRFLTLLCLTVCGLCAQKFHLDDPLENELKPIPVADASKRKLSDYYDAVSHSLATPGDIERRQAAQGVNTLGEPMQGAWWTKRHYYHPMSLDELVAGPGNTHAPSMQGQWTVIGAKSEGITPGFVMIDSKKEMYYIKFDPLTNPEMATGADHVAIRLVHALGYHVPENYLVEFSPSLLALGNDVLIADRLGRQHKMNSRDLGEMLRMAPKTKEGKYRATASRAIPGKGIGPYRYFGVRSDDPNDYVPHEHRRDLRGLAVVSAWIDHDDSRAINTYDSLIDGSIRHYILDLGSSLGSGTQKANSPRSGGEYLFGWKQSAGQLFSLGFAVPSWARADYPKLPSIGLFESKTFDPEKWVPEYPNPAFLNRLPDDEFWAAKQIVSFSDEEIEAIVRSARYSDREAERWLIRCLVERRDKIGRSYFAKVLPIDQFTYRDGDVKFVDLAEKAGYGAVGPFHLQWLSPQNSYRTAVITTPSRPRQSVEVTVRLSGQPTVVGVERTW
ncbi:MAG: hypothetical protein K2X03_23535 [Bryobacteraceae bacterium]|nr:hypothetical protein [Bryobacteraceae bacterium]